MSALERIRTAAAWVHVALVVLVAAGVFVQVYLIGAYIFGAGTDALDAHRDIGFAVHACEVLVLVAALVAWLPRPELLLSLLLAAGGTVQITLASSGDAWTGALHPLGALLVLVVAAALLQRRGRRRAGSAPQRAT